jgi:predicted secreted Zn-dependent protease
MPAVVALAACSATVPGASAPPPLPIGVRAQVMEQPYDVQGLTRLEISRSLTEGARTYVRGGFRGYNQWNVRWQFRYAPSSRGCNITSSAVNLQSVTTLPRWVDRDRADSALVAEWDRYIGALRLHENGHRDIAYRAAAEIQRTLRRFAAGSCTSISPQANRVAQDILERHQRENSVYDEETRHGATQGASWQARGRIAAPIGSALSDGVQLVYVSADVAQAPWVYDSVRVVERAGFDRCVVVARAGQELRESCVRGDTLFEGSAAGAHTVTRPVGANMTLTVTAASGGVLEYTTEHVVVQRMRDGMDLPTVRTVIIIRDSAGTIIRRLREDYAPTLLTAAHGVFEEPDDAGGWKTIREFSLSAVRPAVPGPALH